MLGQFVGDAVDADLISALVDALKGAGAGVDACRPPSVRLSRIRTLRPAVMTYFESRLSPSAAPRAVTESLSARPREIGAVGRQGGQALRSWQSLRRQLRSPEARDEPPASTSGSLRAAAGFDTGLP